MFLRWPRGIFDTPEGKPAHWEYDIFGKWCGSLGEGSCLPGWIHWEPPLDTGDMGQPTMTESWRDV